MKKIHKIKLFFLKIKWYFDLLNFARNHSKEVDDYKFLVKLKKEAHQKYLEIERKELDDEKLTKLKIQLDLIDKILNYVKR